jgi:hypothetical protein
MRHVEGVKACNYIVGVFGGCGVNSLSLLGCLQAVLHGYCLRLLCLLWAAQPFLPRKAKPPLAC